MQHLVSDDFLSGIFLHHTDLMRNYNHPSVLKFPYNIFEIHSQEPLILVPPQNQESNAILRQKNNLKLYYENNLQKTKSKP